MQMSKLSIKRANVDYVVAVAIVFILLLYFLSFLSCSFWNHARQTKTESAVTKFNFINF